MAGAFSRTLRLNSVIICDQVRREDSGKELLLGVYSGGIVVHRPAPATLPLVVRCELASSKPRSSVEYTIEIFSPSGASLAKGKTTGQIDPPQKVLIVGAKFAALPLSQEGEHTVHLSVDGQKATEVYSFSVSFNVPAPLTEASVTLASPPVAKKKKPARK